RDGGLHQRATQAVLRGGEPGVGQQRVRARDPAPRRGEIIHARDHTARGVCRPLWPLVLCWPLSVSVAAVGYPRLDRGAASAVRRAPATTTERLTCQLVSAGAVIQVCVARPAGDGRSWRRGPQGRRL